ncbi:hypothetical protein DL98DRAFT_612598 [Cadophora sp. DSE1049]|nr:hypothetical protein DL98DRAFT_612598 [Cadophora sp. DSE1049]
MANEIDTAPLPQATPVVPAPLSFTRTKSTSPSIPSSSTPSNSNATASSNSQAMDSLLATFAAYKSKILDSPTTTVLASNTMDIETENGALSLISPIVVSEATIAERRMVILPKLVNVPVLGMPVLRKLKDVVSISGPEAGEEAEDMADQRPRRERDMGLARRGAIVAPLTRHYSQVAVFGTCGSPETDLWASDSESEVSDVENEDAEEDDEGEQDKLQSKREPASKEHSIDTVEPLIRHNSYIAVIESWSPTETYDVYPYPGAILPLQISKNASSPSSDEYAPHPQDLSPLQALFDEFTEPWARSPAGDGDEGQRYVHWSECASPRSLSEVSETSGTWMTSGPQPTRKRKSRRSENAQSECCSSSESTEEGTEGMAGMSPSKPTNLSMVNQNPWVNDGRKSFARDIANVVKDYESTVACIEVFASLDVEGLIADPGPEFVDLDLGDADWILEPHPVKGDEEMEDLVAEIEREERHEMKMEKKVLIKDEGPVDAGINENLSPEITMQEITAIDTEKKCSINDEVHVDAGIDVDLIGLDLQPGRFSALSWRLRKFWDGSPVSAPLLPLQESR